MKRVTGIGGIFFKCDDVSQTKQWYKEHLGIAADQYGANFKWLDPDTKEESLTVWNPFPANTPYFDPSQQSFMINYRVADLEALLEELKTEGVTIVGDMQSFEYGKFAWILDPNGNKIELWEPINGVL